MGLIKLTIVAAGVVAVTSTALTVPDVGTRYVVRITYTADLEGVVPYLSRERCDVTRSMVDKDLPELSGFEKFVECVAVGGSL